MEQDWPVADPSNRGKTIPDLTPTAMREAIDSVAELIDVVTRMPRKRRR